MNSLQTLDSWIRRWKTAWIVAFVLSLAASSALAQGTVYWIKDSGTVKYRDYDGGSIGSFSLGTPTGRYPGFDTRTEQIYYSILNLNPSQLRRVDVGGGTPELILTLSNLITSPQLDSENDAVYFVESNRIRKGVLSTGTSSVIITGTTIRRWIDIDLRPEWRKIYYTNGGQVRRANLDGSDNEAMAFLGDTAHGVSVDEANNFVYCIGTTSLGQGTTYWMKKIDLTTKAVTDVLTSGVGQNPGDLRVDGPANRIFFYGGQALKTCDLDGNGITTIDSGGAQIDITIDDRPDCNGNGVADADDIANTTSGDCNSNGVPDECDISAGIVCDGDGDGVPDSCQPCGCVHKWTGSDQSTYGTASNWDNDVVPPNAEGARLHNTAAGNNSCVLAANRTACSLTVRGNGGSGFWQELALGSFQFTATHEAEIKDHGRVTLSDGSLQGPTTVRAGGEISGYGNVSEATNRGLIDGDPNRTLTLASIDNKAPGLVQVHGDGDQFNGVGKILFSGAVTQEGEMLATDFGLLEFTNAVDNDGEMNFEGGWLRAPGLVNNSSVTVTQSAWGNRSLFNDPGVAGAIAVTNKGDFTIEAGAVLDIDGCFDAKAGSNVFTSGGFLQIRTPTNAPPGCYTNDGFIGPLCRVNGGACKTGLASEVTVIGDFTSTVSSEMLFEEVTFRVSGDFDVAINDPANFDFSQGTLNLNGLGIEGVQHLEVMTPDSGNGPQSPPFEILEVHISSGASVALVDNHSNTTPAKGQNETLYVASLVLEDFSTFDVAGRTVYYQSLSQGTGVTIDDSVGGGGLTVYNPTSVPGDTPLGPRARLHVSQNAPNPFNPRTTIEFELGQQSHVSVEVFDTRGKLVATLLEELRSSGTHSLIWNGTDALGQEVSSGTYFYRVQAGHLTEVKKMALLR